MKDKKGVALTTTFAVFILILIVGTTFLVSFLVSSKLRWILIGIAILIGFVYMIGQAMTSKFTTTKTIILLVFLGVGLFFIIGSGYLQTYYPGNFVKPSWGRLECAPTYAYEGVYSKMLDVITMYACNMFTEECRFTVTHIKPGVLVTSLRTRYKNCNTQGYDCGGWVSLAIDAGGEKTLPTIKSGRMYVFDIDGIYIGEKHANVVMSWKPWKLYRYVGGGRWIVNSYNCDITSGAKPNIRSEDYPITGKLYRTGGEGTNWINYIDDWNYGPATNVFTHSTYGIVYCTAGQIFDIVELQMQDGSLKKLDPAYSGTLYDGEYLSGLGSRLAYVECCPNEPNCGDDFKYLPEPEPEKECISDLQCYNAGGPVPVDGTHYIIWQCIDDKCIRSASIEVECTASVHCPTGHICDLSTMNYGKCIEQTTSYCGDGTCDITESFSTCPEDCKEVIECKWFESYYETEHCGLRCKIGLAKPTTEAGCKTAGFIYALIGGLILGISAITIAIVKIKSKKKKKKKKK